MANASNFLSGRCLCSSVRWNASDHPLWQAHCHCESCRRAASAPYVNWIGFDRSYLIWTGKREFFKSSAKVTRSFCPTCGTPLTFETEVLPTETHIYAVTCTDPSKYQAQGHLYWSEKLDWVHVDDTLPKHAFGLQSAATKGQNIL